ncbi:hypothetical protein C8R44DRAFT_989147 [Mycena epipterygia]|nr:hypothetical protein C8R44DRAFT_989147 [Mycena epipterygia]
MAALGAISASLASEFGTPGPMSTPTAALPTVPCAGTSTIRIASVSMSHNKGKSSAESNNRALAEGYKKMLEDKRKSIKIHPKYEGGALRLTRTPGRNHVNTVSLGDLIDPKALSAACVFSFCIEDDYFFQHFPLKTNTNHREHCLVYAGRDLESRNSSEFDSAVDAEQKTYLEKYGRNFRAFFPRMTKGLAHSKIMILIYPDFLCLVITSANLYVFS